MKVPLEGSTTFRDEFRGNITFDHSNVDDQVLMKSDGFPTYHLANVVDDQLMHITYVIRAEEWISSTPKHVLLYQAFGWQLPRFWHMPLLRNLDKSKISKRKNPVSLVYYRESGFLPQAVLNFLGLMGGGMPSPTPIEIANGAKENEIFSLDEMVQRFDVPGIRLGGPVFDLTKLRWLNSEYIRALTPEDFYDALRSTILTEDYLRSVAPLVQSRIETLGEFGDLTAFLFQDKVLPPPEVWIPKKRTPEDALAFATEQLAVLEALPAEAWSHTPEAHSTMESALKKLGEEKSWSTKENFMLLRAILTGSTMSPPLIESMVVFGKARTLDRLRRFLEAQKKGTWVQENSPLSNYVNA